MNVIKFHSNSFLKRQIVLCKNFPSLLAHESSRRIFALLSHRPHPCARDEVVVVIIALRRQEVHFICVLVESCYLKVADFNIIDHIFDVLKEFLTVPDIITVKLRENGMLQARWISSGNEVSNAAISSGGSVPKYFSRTSIVHRRGPDCQNCVFGL